MKSNKLQTTPLKHPETLWLNAASSPPKALRIRPSPCPGLQKNMNFIFLLLNFSNTFAVQFSYRSYKDRIWEKNRGIKPAEFR